MENPCSPMKSHCHCWTKNPGQQPVGMALQMCNFSGDFSATNRRKGTPGPSSHHVVSVVPWWKSVRPCDWNWDPWSSWLVHPDVLNVGWPKRNFYVLKPWMGCTKEAWLTQLAYQLMQHILKAGISSFVSMNGWEAKLGPKIVQPACQVIFVVFGSFPLNIDKTFNNVEDLIHSSSISWNWILDISPFLWIVNLHLCDSLWW